MWYWQSTGGDGIKQCSGKLGQNHRNISGHSTCSNLPPQLSIPATLDSPSYPTHIIVTIPPSPLMSFRSSPSPHIIARIPPSPHQNPSSPHTSVRKPPLLHIIVTIPTLSHISTSQFVSIKHHVQVSCQNLLSCPGDSHWLVHNYNVMAEMTHIQRCSIQME